jgi:hypothetical protein
MMKSERGSVFWRILIVILSAAVVLSILIPQFSEKRQESNMALCRERMSQVAQAEVSHRRARGLYTNDLDSLQMFPPGRQSFACPNDNRSYIVTFVDSTDYTISCPNDHGMISSGSKSWEKR